MKKQQAKFSIVLLLFSTSVAFAQPKSKTKVDPETAEVANLIKNNLVVNAFQEIERLEPTTIKELIELTEIEAPPFKESLRAAKMKQLFETAGADKVWIDSIGNVLAVRKGKNSAKAVVLDGHLDTVFPAGTDVKVKHHGDTLYAPGIGDCTRGLISILTVLRALEKAQIETNKDILFVASVGEEGLGDLRGVKYLLSKDISNIHSWISVDGSTDHEIVTGSLGSIRYKAVVTGPGGHSWADFGLGNPHHAMAKSLNYFAEAATRFTNSVTKTSFNVGRTGGGTSINAIPFESWAEIDMRSESALHLKTIDSIFKANMNKGLNEYNQQISKGNKLAVAFNQVGYRPTGSTNPTAPLVMHAQAAVRAIGLQPKLTTESTNANVPISKGIPAITISWGGKSDHFHSLNEWWLNDKGAEGIKLALLITLSEAGISK